VVVAFALALAPVLPLGCSKFSSDEPTPSNSDVDGSTATDANAPVMGTPDRGLTIVVGDPKATSFVVQGDSLAVPVKLTRRPSSTGPVDVTVAKLPADVTADPLTIPEGATEATLTLRAKPTSVQGGPSILDITAIEKSPRGTGAATKLSAFVRGKAGQLDTTFGTNGLVRHAVGSGKNALGRDLVVLDDDRLLAVGECATNACVVRSSANGVLDSTYGTGGVGAVAVGLIGQAIADPSGAVVVSGNGGANSLKIGRLTDKGQPDATFGGGTGSDLGTRQFVPPGAGPPEQQRTSLAIRKDGTLAIGFAHIHQTPTLGLALLSPAGAVVTSFGTNGSTEGRALLDGTPPAIGIRASGAIWAVSLGNGICYGDQVDGSTGKPDPTFGGDGTYVVCGLSPRWGLGAAVALSDGSIVLAFRSVSNVLVGKWVPDGKRLDLTWGSGGVATLSETGLPSVSVDKKGLILVMLAGTGALRFLRLNVNGALDSSFGQAGAVTHSFGTNQEIVRVLVQKDGRIVVLGTEEFADGSDMTLSRYWN